MPMRARVLAGCVVLSWSCFPCISCKHARPIEAPPASSEAPWRYRVDVAQGGGELAIEGVFGPSSGDVFVIDPQVVAYVKEVKVQEGSSFRDVAETDEGWNLPCLGGCRVRYRFALAEVARALGDPETAIASGGAYIAPTSTFLLHPSLDHDARGAIRIEVHAEEGRFFTALHPAPEGPKGTYALDREDLRDAGFSAFGELDHVPIDVSGARIDVAIARAGMPLDVEATTRWLRADVAALAAEYRTFPIEHVLVVVMAHAQSGPTRGVTLGGGGASLLIRLGREVTPSNILADDWVFTHEMIHVGSPDLPREQAWFSEGLASYLEPFVRARAAMITAEKVWGDLLEGMPQGLPEPGDQGLDRTHTWGRTYWGGALFCLLADLGIREATSNQRSLDDVVRAVSAHGGNVLARWPFARYLDVGDEATGTHVLHELYAKMANAPVDVNLTALWKRLGVRAGPQGVVFDDGAPAAAIRRSMTRKNESS